jgi:hypothetical protein
LNRTREIGDLVDDRLEFSDQVHGISSASAVGVTLPWKA